ncbi:MAG: hypothetical protein HHJ09_07020 [Glaciimonas sp.]|nr:hypothetical protein [Glaciimonas sp.]
MKSYTTAGFVILVLVSQMLPGYAFDIYRYRMPGGSTLYTNKVVTKGGLQEVIASPAPDTQQVIQEQHVKIKNEGARLNRLAALRQSSLDNVEKEISDVTRELEKAKVAAAEGVTPHAGERRGIKGGHSRLSQAYWERQRALHQTIDDARESLDDAYSARNTLR